MFAGASEPSKAFVGKKAAAKPNAKSKGKGKGKAVSLIARY
jgi:hypothetical protein